MVRSQSAFSVLPGLILTCTCLLPPLVLTATENKFRDKGFVQNLEHIKSHLQGKVKLNLDEAKPHQLEFHFFQLHDTNNDKKLDGLEIMRTLEHSVMDDMKEEMAADLSETEKEELQARMFKFLTNTVDLILKEDDTDNNGYLTYAEFRRGRKTESMWDNWF